MDLAGVVLLAIVAGCATVPGVDRPPEVRVQTVTVSVPVPVPCFEESDRPKMPEPSTLNPETATTLQLVADEAATAIAWQIYGEQVDRLFKACMKTSGVIIP